MQQKINQTCDPLAVLKFSDRNMKKNNLMLARSEILTVSQKFTGPIIHIQRPTAATSFTTENKDQFSITDENWSSLHSLSPRKK